MLTGLRIRNFKGFEDVEIELGQTVVFVGPNNSGKTTALQALTLWEIGLRKWRERYSAKTPLLMRFDLTLNRRDLIAAPVPIADLLWRDLKISADGAPVLIEVAVSGITEGISWDCGFEFEWVNSESLDFRPVGFPVTDGAAQVRVAFLPAMSGMTAVEDRLSDGAVNVRIGEGRTAEVLRNLCYQVYEAEDGSRWNELVTQIKSLFGVTLNPPEYIEERGQITMFYEER